MRILVLTKMNKLISILMYTSLHLTQLPFPICFPHTLSEPFVTFSLSESSSGLKIVEHSFLTISILINFCSSFSSPRESLFHPPLHYWSNQLIGISSFHLFSHLVMNINESHFFLPLTFPSLFTSFPLSLSLLTFFHLFTFKTHDYLLFVRIVHKFVSKQFNDPSLSLSLLFLPLSLSLWNFQSLEVSPLTFPRLSLFVFCVLQTCYLLLM